jgi:hypothetical protein
MAVVPCVVQADCTVRGTFVRKGTLVSLDLAGTLAAEYGTGNLQPLAATQSGDDADHVAEGN